LKAVKLNDIKIVKLKKIKNINGDIMRFLKKNDSNYKKFGEVYFSWVKPQKVKAWKFHTKMSLNLTVPYGKVKFVFFFEKLNKFLTISVGENNYKMIAVPPRVWFGFKGISKHKSLIVNLANLAHNKKEILRRKKEEIRFNW
tara:strand:+ start:682 stop:1107 length:426 start_codon:yes stop_codon:yes gene_type:complete